MHVIFISINQAPKAKPLHQQEYLSPSCIKYASDFSPVHLNPLPGILYGVKFRKKKHSLFNCDQLNNPGQRGLTRLLAGIVNSFGMGSLSPGLFIYSLPSSLAEHNRLF